ncbi:3,4-dihydroxy-2-butanone-4-phosphate synthase [Rhodococcus sovatensis]|uniref:3,4-dihydroxy-2-butanone-4-phosphate synthase n=1 Tax=Rhodococcus sovatensis TaxID=1805840 RepID=A0ABZ2PI84_9NOCA
MIADFRPASAGLGLVARATAELGEGRPVVVVDRSLHAGLGAAVVLLAAELATPHWTSWIIGHTSGLLFAPLASSRADELGLPPMVETHIWQTLGSTVAVDAASGIGTGISAVDRSRTARVLADPSSTAQSLIRPGHVIPVRADPRGVLGRTGFAEAGVDLCTSAGLQPVALLSDLVNDDGSLCTPAEACEFASRMAVALVEVDDVFLHQLYRGSAQPNRLSASASGKRCIAGTKYAERTYSDAVIGSEHTALTIDDGSRSAYFVHVECEHVDVFDRIACGCEASLSQSLASVACDGGALVYLRRGINGKRIDTRFYTTAFDAIRVDLQEHSLTSSPATTSWVWSEKSNN